MKKFIPPRLRKPGGIALAGVLFAAAWLVRGGPLWWVSIPGRDPPPPPARFTCTG